MKRALVPAVIFSLAMCGAPAVARAHALGYSFEATTSPYVIDIGYDTGTIEEGATVAFDIGLKDEHDASAAPFEYVWVRLLRDGKTVLATGIHRQEFGPTTLLLTFDRAGSYELNVSYRKKEEIAAAKFPVTVQPSPEGGRGVLMLAASALGGAIIGLVAGFAYRRYRASKG